MPKLKLIALAILLFSTISIAQTNDFNDTYLAENFKLLNTVDSELAIAISPIIENRLKRELKDSSSFYNSHTNLSKYISINMSEDSLVKTYSWDRIDGGTWHDMASYAQYKTSSGTIKYLRLDSGNEGDTGEPTSVIIYDIFHIKAKKASYYLLLGWGTYGGGMHHSLARVYRITNDEFVLCDSMFQGQQYALVTLPRVAKINLTYNPKTKELSYFNYDDEGDNTTHQEELKRDTWLFKNGTFIKQD